MNLSISLSFYLAIFENGSPIYRIFALLLKELICLTKVLATKKATMSRKR